MEIAPFFLAMNPHQEPTAIDSTPVTEELKKEHGEEDSEILAESKRIFERIFVYVDFETSPHEAIAAALELRRSFGSALCLFRMAELSGGDEFLGGIGSPAVAVDLIEEARGRLVRLLHNIAPHEDDVDVRAGLDVHPLEGLKQEARRWGATLVVVSESVHAFFRSPAEKIIHDFDIPVLVIPPRR